MVGILIVLKFMNQFIDLILPMLEACIEPPGRRDELMRALYTDPVYIQTQVGI